MVSPVDPADDLEVPILLLDPALPMPVRAHPSDAGVDLVARESILLLSGGGRAMVPTGVALALPPGFAGFVQPRSGLAARDGITVLNAPGLIDPGYRDEVKVVLVNTGTASFQVRRGDRIAQLVIQAVARPRFVPVSELSDSDRGRAGFGSSGR